MVVFFVCVYTLSPYDLLIAYSFSIFLLRFVWYLGLCNGCSSIHMLCELSSVYLPFKKKSTDSLGGGVVYVQELTPHSERVFVCRCPAVEQPSHCERELHLRVLPSKAIQMYLNEW